MFYIPPLLPIFKLPTFTSSISIIFTRSLGRLFLIKMKIWSPNIFYWWITWNSGILVVSRKDHFYMRGFEFIIDCKFLIFNFSSINSWKQNMIISLFELLIFWKKDSRATEFKYGSIPDRLKEHKRILKAPYFISFFSLKSSYFIKETF